MERVKGIGGVFFRAKDPKKLQVWYRKNVGIYRMRTGTGCLSGQKANRHNPASSMWAPFDQDTDYFGDSDQQIMVNYRVKNLDAMVTQLREASVVVDKRIEDNECGRFAWATDLEGKGSNYGSHRRINNTQPWRKGEVLIGWKDEKAVDCPYGFCRIGFLCLRTTRRGFATSQQEGANPARHQVSGGIWRCER